MNKLSMSILFSVLVSISFAQEKNEVEKRVKKNEVPQDAIDWFKDAYETQSKVRWYYQTDGDDKSYEVKLKYKKQWHSIEFDLDGQVLDIEIQIEENEILDDARQSIMDYLNTTFTKYSIKKIQIQFTGDADDLEDLIDENEMEDLKINYEIEYYGKTDSDNALFEGLFDENGQLLQQRIMTVKLTDNLDY